ncbi:hypothetical protein DY000_02012647 [Brassica cretica]|uniref:Uncharacterized protein n=1 Tax=Brassica cretica TaxID=69181 RepID=A0ABQ7DA62_BRACR|nr:hypothetical protein DY000_02012647 [Brassica cretica]
MGGEVKEERTRCSDETTDGSANVTVVMSMLHGSGGDVNEITCSGGGSGGGGGRGGGVSVKCGIITNTVYITISKSDGNGGEDASYGDRRSFVIDQVGGRENRQCEKVIKNGVEDGRANTVLTMNDDCYDGAG